MSKKVSISNLVVLGIALSFSGYASIYFDFGKHVLGKPAEVFADSIWQFCFYSHIALGITALVTGGLQFVSYLRVTNVSLHKTIGKIYVAAVLTSGTLSIYTSALANGGFWGRAGFLTISLLWMTTTVLAYKHTKAGRVEQHLKWITRSYAITWSSISLRFWLSLFTFGLNWNFTIAYVLSIWLALIINLLFAEYLILRKRIFY